MRRAYFEGDVYKNGRGVEVVLVSKIDYKTWLAKVNKTGESFVVHLNRLKNGTFKTPVCKTVYGVGYMGQGKYFCRDSSGVLAKEYVVWANMIKRCYTNYSRDKSNGLYDDVNVAEDWHNYQNFAEWYTTKIKVFDENNIIPKIDKDLLGGRDYSPDNCVILPNIINCSLGETRSTSSFCHGVIKRGSWFCANIMIKNKTISLGRFKTQEDALAAYISKKKDNLKQLADEYKNVLEYRAYNALVNWNPSGEKHG
jgi:hypothetical protein